MVSVACGSRNWANEEDFVMKVFVINLRRGVARREKIASRLAELNVEHEIVEAIDGAELSEEKKSKAVNRFIFWCRVGRGVLDGEIGCALSHAKIYKRFIEDQAREGIDKIPCICILEDDAIVSDRFKETLADIERTINTEKPEVVLLSNHDGQLFFADGYVLTAKAAAAMLKFNTPMQSPCDFWWLWQKKGLLSVRHCELPVVSQDIHQTMIGRTLALSQMNLAQKIVWKVKRTVGLSIVGVMDMFGKNGSL